MAKRSLTGIKPTGRRIRELWARSARRWRSAEHYRRDYFVADYHAMTTSDRRPLRT